MGYCTKYVPKSYIIKINKMKKKFHTVVNVPKSNTKIVECGKMNIPNSQTHDCSLFWLGTSTSIKIGGAKLFHGSKPPLLVK
jgi:hypothetical protein